MATPFSYVYNRMLSKIENLELLKETDEVITQILLPFLRSSIVKFKKCTTKLTRDETMQIFTEELSDEEQEILAQLMTVEYLTPKLNTSDLLEQKLSSKDYKIYSQANQIKEIRELRDTMKKEAQTLMTKYSYSSYSLDDMK
jgi:hypothetical protein